MLLPPYTTFPIITGDKISLREILHSDIEDILEISYYNAIQATSLEEAKLMLAKINQDYMRGNSIHWGIADNETDKIIGTCGYYRGLDKGEGELGCVLLPAYRGKAVMTEAMKMAINFGKNSIRLTRITASTAKQNTKAIKLLERLNFVQVSNGGGDEIEFELDQTTVQFNR